MRPIRFSALVCLWAASAVACGGSSGSTSTDGGADAPSIDASASGDDATASGGDASAGDGGSDAAILDAAGEGGDGGGGGGGGTTGTALAAGATVSTSPHYRLYATLGQGPASNANSQSTHYVLHGGVVGATQQP